MKNHLRISILFAMLSSLSLQAAASEVTVGELTYGGTGCPVNTLDIYQTDDRTEFLVFPQQFVVASSGRIDRKACALSLPVTVGENVQVALVSNFYGFAEVGATGRLSIQQETFIAGTRSPVIEKEIQGEASTFFEIFENDPANLTWSQCGEAANLRVNLSLLARSHVDAYVDAVQLQVLVRDCKP